MSAFSDQEKAVARVIVEGLKNGLSEARSLDRAGLLLTPEHKVDIASRALLDVAQLLDETRVGDIIQIGTSLSANDIKKSVVTWIEQIVESNRHGQ